ncbi:MAG: hypothetical protein K0Q87_1108 [Neobacillus sp.]|nr:hypothetical protein [Neobacillus sp.]
MKKLLILALTLMMALSLVACGTTNGTRNSGGMTNSNTNSNQQEPMSATPGKSEQAKTEDASKAQAQSLSPAKKVLVAYYSRSGNTREIARQIQKNVGGDIFEIQTVDPYPRDYDAVTKQAKQEIESGYKPALKTKIDNIKSYDVIFVGSPNWWSTIAPPVATFLSEYDLSGKTIVPFITHAGSGKGQSVTDIAKLCPQSTVLDGFAVWGRDVKSSQNEVSKWLRELNL